MNIGLVGYGRMGRLIHTMAEQRGHRITLIVDPNAPDAHEPCITPALLSRVEGIIEFSLPEGLEHTMRVYSQGSPKVVLGTTGWDEDREKILSLWDVASQKGALLYGSNFSVGANLLFRLGAIAAKMTAALPEYDLMIHEYHHKHKKDSPSGTALTLAQQVLNNNPRKTSIVSNALTNRAINTQELHVSSTRGGAIPGTHTLSLDSDADTLSLTHTARNREGFALGSILGLEWLADKTGIFRTDEFFTTLFKEQEK